MEDMITSKYFYLAFDDVEYRDQLNKKLKRGLFSKDNTSLVFKVERILGQVQRILKMYPGDMSFDICILKNKRAVEDKSLELYKYYNNAMAFYSPRKNTVFCSAKNTNYRMLAHEIAHVVITKNFKIVMPGHIQEVICQWVERQI